MTPTFTPDSARFPAKTHRTHTGTRLGITAAAAAALILASLAPTAAHAAPTIAVGSTTALEEVVILPGESKSVPVGELPAGTTAVELKFTGVGQYRDTEVIASNGTTGPSVVVLEAVEDEVSVNTVTLPVPDDYRGTITLTSTAASIRVNTTIVDLEGDFRAPVPAPEPAPLADVAPAAVEAPAAEPAESGVPGADTTGVPAGVALRVHDGDIVVTTAGTVLDGLDIRGTVSVRANDVTIRNSIVRGKPLSGPTGMISNTRGHTGLKIVDTEIAPSLRTPHAMGILGGNFTATRVDIHNVIDGVHINRGNATLEYSWLHDNVHYTDDPNHGGDDSHDDSIQIQAGDNIRVVGNNISGAYNSGIQLTQDAGRVSNVTIARNLLDGGGCTVNLAEKGVGPFQGISITDNKFGRNTRHDSCAIISPDSTRPVNERNIYVPDGAAVEVRQG
jgi:hypothetical protein